jgi:Cu+-exporting ATPase
MKQITLKLMGMSCASCASNIQKAISNVPGVIESEVNFALERSRVFYDEKIANIENIREAIEKAGYSSSPFEKDKTASVIAEKKQNSEYLELQQKIYFGTVVSLILLLGSLPMMTGLDIAFIPSWLGNPWLQLILATPVLFWCGAKFYLGFWKSLKRLRANMDTLIVLGTNAAYFYSLFVTLVPSFVKKQGIATHIYYETSAIVITLILLGKLLEQRAKGQTSEAITKLVNLQPKNARALRNEKFEDIPITELVLGDIILVRPGEKIPTDGIIVNGSSSIDEAMITGESIPVTKKTGEEVIGGTINGLGSFEFKTTKLGKDTFLAQIISLVEEAQYSKAPIQKLADQVTSWFVPVVIVLAFLTWLVWLKTTGNISLAILNAVSVLIIACPCSLGLAVPTSMMVGIGKGAENGILIKGGEALELSHKIDTIVVDKTGTLTQGRLIVNKFVVLDKQQNELTLLQLAASLEALSEHPLAQAIQSYAQELQVSLLHVEHFQAIPGNGVEGIITGLSVLVGTRNWLEKKGINIQELSNYREKWQFSQETVVFLAVEGEVQAAIAIADTLKPNSGSVVESLKKMGLQVIMLTGDNQATADAIAREVGIFHVLAQVQPQNKAQQIKNLQSANKTVAMVGDGINDAPALAQADLGIAIGTGTDVAISAADITLIAGNLQGIVTVLQLSKAIRANIRQNLFFAYIYNIIGIPIAAGLLYPLFGWSLNPILAGGAMAFSSVSVVTNALRLRNFRAKKII